MFPLCETLLEKKTMLKKDRFLKWKKYFLQSATQLQKQNQNTLTNPPIHKLFPFTSGIILSFRMSTVVSISTQQWALPLGREVEVSLVADPSCQASFHKNRAPPQTTTTLSNRQGETTQTLVQMHFLGAWQETLWSGLQNRWALGIATQSCKSHALNTWRAEAAYLIVSDPESEMQLNWVIFTLGFEGQISHQQDQEMPLLRRARGVIYSLWSIQMQQQSMP